MSLVLYLNTMKKHYFLFTVFILFTSILIAQPYKTNPDYKRANIWYFGYGSGLDFNSGNPIPIFDGQVNDNWEGFSTLCDTSGKVLFYSSPTTIWNKNHNIVSNGTGLLGHTSSTQGSLLLIHPENDSLVYLFTTPSAVNLNTGLRYNIINANLNNGEGEVIQKNKLLLTPTTEKLTAIKHANGKDIWVIAHGYTSNSYFAYLLTKEGLIECPIQSVTGNILEEIPALWQSNSVGNLISNYKGDKIAAAIFRTGKVEIFDFDNNTGRLDISDTINLNLNVYCVAYNGIGNRLYIQAIDNNRDTSYLYYYENRKLNLIAKYLHGQIQYLINFHEVIYVANMDSTFLSTIENINDSIPTFHANAIDLSPSVSSAGLPNFNQSYLYTPPVNFTFKVNCVNNTIQLNGQDTFAATTHDWHITKLGIAPITAHVKNPLIQLEDTGTYDIYYLASDGVRSDTISKKVIILPKIYENFLGKDTGWCEQIGASITLQAPNNMHCYEWSTGENLSSINVDTTGVFICKITTPNFCVHYDTINIVIDSIPEIPNIYQNFDTLKTDATAKGYQWYKNNQEIGENNNYLKIIDTGIYSLKIVSNAGCTSQSDTLQVHRVGIHNIEKLMVIVYPNPFENELVIKTKEKVQITIYNSIGQDILKTITNDNLIKINTAEWEQGVYFLEVAQSNGIKQVIKIIK